MEEKTDQDLHGRRQRTQSQGKRKSTFKKKEKNKDDKNDNKNKMTVWDRLGWFKKRLPIRHNLDGFKQYNFTNCNVTLRKYLNKPLVVHLLLQRHIKVKSKIYISKVVLHGAVEVWCQNFIHTFYLN